LPSEYPASWYWKPRNRYVNPAASVTHSAMKWYRDRRSSSGTTPVPLVE
jgi:hypothetical protein